MDDDDDIRDALCEALRQEGYYAIEAENGLVALESLRVIRPCVVLLDLMMPTLDGWAVIRAMQANRQLATVPICIVSALSSPSNVNMPSADCVLQKPISRTELLAVVARYCGSH